MNRIISIILGILSFVSVSAQSAILDSLWNSLAESRTAKDSIAILFNIFDCTHADEGNPLLEQIYELGLREKDYSSVNYALATLSAFTSQNDSMQQVLVERSEALPPYEINRSTLLYLKVRRAVVAIGKMDEQERQAKMLEYLAGYRDRDWSNADIYEQAENLFMLVTYLRTATNGDMLTQYLLELQDLIKKINPPNLFLQSLFIRIASQVFIDNNMYEAAAQVNRDKLELLKDFDKADFMRNRQYRSYDGSMFNTYLSLLMCQEVLSEEELDLFYNRIVEIEKTRRGARFSEQHMRTAAIYYLIGKKEYSRAMPLIQAHLKEKVSLPERIRLLGYLIEAAKAVNDKTVLLESLSEHNELLKQHIADRADASYKELQILYDVQTLKQQNADLAHDNQIIAIERQRAITVATVIGLVLVLVILIFLSRQYRKAHKLSKRLKKSNAKLENERKTLKDTQRDLIEARDQAKAADRVKTDFVNTLSHELRGPLSTIVEYANMISDSVDGDTQPYIRRFAEIVTRNSELVNTIANDILEAPSLEKSNISVRVLPTSVKHVCQSAMGSMDRYLKPNVKLVFANADDQDLIINTDPNRLEQVLRNLLSNALKFTNKGFVRLGYTINKNTNEVIINVTDSGVGVPPDKADVIFERFEKLNSQVPGNGLGLYVARMLTELLGGHLYLDTAYTAGARFILEVPM